MPYSADSSSLSVRKRHCWAKRNAFTRAIGFELLFILGFGKGIGEDEKVVIKTSRKLALVRCSIHIIPIMVSITILILNLGNSYLGRGLPGSIIDPSINIALLQVAAKAQELLMVASVTTIVMHVLRSELIKGEGLPLGLLGGGFLYSSMSYFWSPEFWGSLRLQTSKYAKLRVFGIIILGGVIAAFAGPSTAVLLVPREQEWPAGGTITYMPGPAEDWWPTTLGVKDLPPSDICKSLNAVNMATCLSGGYPALWNARTSVDVEGKAAYIEGSHKNLTTGFSFGPRTVDIQTNLNFLPVMRYHGNYRGYACETSISGPRLANAMYQAQLRRDWIQQVFAIPYNILRYGPSLSQYKYFGSMQVATNSYVPAVRATCSGAQTLRYLESDVRFPVLPHNNCWSSARESAVVKLTELNQSPTNATRATWVRLPEDVGAVSGGIVLELPGVDENSRALVACSFDARWTPGNIITYHLEQTSSLEKTAAQIVATTALLAQPVPATRWVPGYSEFEPVMISADSSRIQFDNTWLNALTPTITNTDLNGNAQNMTTFESIITDAGLLDGVEGSPETQLAHWNTIEAGRVNRTVALEWWVSLILADGLSREGSSKVLSTADLSGDWSLLNYDRVANFQEQLFGNKIALARPTSTTIIEERTHITIGGYAYRATAITDYASAALLLTHIIMALVHTFYSTWTKRSSSSWDSLTELLVLILNSRPALNVLRNTNAGIQDLETYSKRARIIAVQDPIDDPKGGLGGRYRAEVMIEENKTAEDDASTLSAGQQQRGRAASVLSTCTSRENDDAISMSDLQQVSHAPFSFEPSIHESWTFPGNIRNSNSQDQWRSHHHYESTDQLLPRRRIQHKAPSMIRVDQHYS